MTERERGRRLRVMHVVDSLGAGGMENGVVNVANRLRGRIDSWVAALRCRGEFAERMPDSNQVVELGKTGGFSTGVVRRFLRFVREVEPDVVHTHNLGPLIYSSIARLVSPAKFPPVIHGEHSLLERDELGLRRIVQRRLLYRGCSAVHTVSQGLLSNLRENGLVASKMVAIINGVDSERFKPGPEESVVGRGGEFVVGIVGRLVERKRHAMLLRAFEHLASSHPMLRLVIVGDQGPERARIGEMVAESRFRDRIEWVPFQEEPEHFYRKMDLLVVPSESEGLANVVLEAMACGVPVAGSYACGTPEVVRDGETGFLGQIESDEDLAGLLGRALRTGRNELRAMGTRSREDILRRFSLDSMAEAYFGLYQSAVAEQ